MKMIDVGMKEKTERVAVARGAVRMTRATLTLIRRGEVEKGDVLAAARIAAIMAAKRTPDIVPLCHPIALTGVDVKLTPRPGKGALEIEVTVRSRDRTGVEMEALTAVCAAGLTVYDMCKSVDRGMTLAEVQLVKKAGGKSGTWERKAAPSAAARSRA